MLIPPEACMAIHANVRMSSFGRRRRRRGRCQRPRRSLLPDVQLHLAVLVWLGGFHDGEHRRWRSLWSSFDITLVPLVPGARGPQATSGKGAKIGPGADTFCGENWGNHWRNWAPLHRVYRLAQMTLKSPHWVGRNPTWWAGVTKAFQADRRNGPYFPKLLNSSVS